MFDLFRKPVPIRSDLLGEMRFRRGLWRGTCRLAEFAEVEVMIEGSRAGPGAGLLDIATELPARLPELKPVIRDALAEHLEPYRDAAPEPDRFSYAAPDDIWADIRMTRVLIEEPARPLTTFAFETAWDEEHLLGIRFREWRLFDVSGSLGPPF